MVKTGRKYVKILGIKIDSTSIDLVLAKIDSLMTSEAKFYIVTPNPEIILKAQSNPDLASILNQAQLSIPDGVGLKLAKSSLNIIHGRKLMLEICNLAESRGYKTFFLGGSFQSNQKALKKIRKKYPDLSVDGASGPKYDDEATPVTQDDISTHFDVLARINEFTPDIIFVALGAPKQEQWIKKYLPIVQAKAAMAVGGGLDYLSEEASLPPLWMQKLELEWLWRLFTQPVRLGRIINAVIVFPLKLLLVKN